MSNNQTTHRAYIYGQDGRLVPLGIQIMSSDFTGPPDIAALRAATDAAIRALFQDDPPPDGMEGTQEIVPFNISGDRSARADGSIIEVSPSTENEEKINVQNPYDGPIATVQRHDPDGGNSTDAPYFPHDSWKTRFSPMISVDDPRQISIARIDPNLFHGMSMMDWESFANRLEEFSPQGPSRECALLANFKISNCSHYSANVTCLGYTSLLFHAAGSDDHFASLLSARPSIIRRDLVKLGHAPIFDETIVEAMCMIGERSTLALSKSHTGEACAAAHIVYQYLVAEYGPAKNAHKVITMEHVTNALLEKGRRIIQHHGPRLRDASKSLEATGLAFGYFVGGYLLYLERQAIHGQKRNAYVILGIKTIVTLGIAIGSFLAAGLGHATAIPVTIAIGVATSGADFTRAGVDRALKIYDWRSGLCLFIEELKASLQASATDVTRNRVIEFTNGLTKTEQWLKYFKKHEGKPGH
ncbi:hypothetical protein PEBR_14237 [Penicillium brasilianum]|uniref:Uncharacterized protein n=1 Tax=Penicillium brasilianum TaxID=104259 RepID=A0A1S9RRQ4_PENBI|nr:hypothetical protein PEBR_14237 [Penicillium brasilianum]